MMWQGIDTIGFITDFADRIYHVDCKNTRLRPASGRAGILGSHLPWGDPRRRWDFVSTGHGDVP
jgi:sugar phosphate isomerase/epimerase